MSYQQPISIFEESGQAKKKYSVWAILALIYLFLIQAGTMMACGYTIKEEASIVPHFLRTKGLLYLLINEKVLIMLYGVIAPLLALAIRKTAGWVLIAIISYFLLELSLMELYRVSFSRPGVYYLFFFIAVTVLSVICLNVTAVKRFYRLQDGNKMILWNVVAFIGGAMWIAYMFYDYRG